MSANFVSEFKHFNERLMVELCEPAEALRLTSDIAYEYFSSFNSTYKRNKKFSASNKFVAPIEKAIGTRWELKKCRAGENHIIRIPKLFQSTFSYVPILQTLTSMFSCEEFTSLYFDYNSKIRTNEVGQNGSKRYTCFTSGSVFVESKFFETYPDSIQLQIAADDFEPCNPLQSKAGRHKICAVYLIIQNLPPKFQSKLQNIHLICLCNSDDLKTRETDFNNIWQIIVDELLILETKGIEIANGGNLKGTLVQTSFDNLEANIALGFSGSFNSNKYCRH